MGSKDSRRRAGRRCWRGNCFPDRPAENLALAAGVAAVLGHVYSCWLKFKGGKGIATSAGVGSPGRRRLAPSRWRIWGIVFAPHRYVSVASIVAAVVLAAGRLVFPLRDAE